MKELEKLMSKAGKSSMSEDAKKAKMEVIMELMEMAKEMMADGVHSGMTELTAPKKMEKVSVMAPDSKGLAKGLDMAKDVIDDGPEAEEAPEHEASESEGEESLEDIAEMVADKSPSMVDEDEEESMFGKSKKSSEKKKLFNMFDDED